MRARLQLAFFLFAFAIVGCAMEPERPPCAGDEACAAEELAVPVAAQVPGDEEVAATATPAQEDEAPTTAGEPPARKPAANPADDGVVWSGVEQATPCPEPPDEAVASRKGL